MLDLGCGYGWHCKYAAEQGAAEVLGLDLSPKMLEEALRRNREDRLRYRVCGIEEYEYPENTWDCVISNLALHYVADLDGVFQKVHRTLAPGGTFVFNIEHPVFTAGVDQDWVYDEKGRPLHWPVDDYLSGGEAAPHPDPDLDGFAGERLYAGGGGGGPAAPVHDEDTGDEG